MILNLQILRAFAALNVVLFHIIGTSEAYGYGTEALAVLQGWGANGVDLFFVISGFVMLYTQLESKRTVSDFLKLRIIRIALIYWFVTLLVILLYLLHPSSFSDFKLTPEWALASLGFVSSVTIGSSPIVNVGWTLEWEMLFYLVFGLSLWFKSWIISLSTTVITLLLIAVLASNFILVEFIAGMAIAILIKKYGFIAHGRASLVIGLLLLSASISSEVRYLIESREILFGIPSALIVYGAVTTTQVKSRVGKLLGDASYSIYLIQVFSIPIFYKFASYVDIEFNSDLLTLMCLLATAIGGTAMYLIVEKPLIGFAKRRVGR